VRVHLGGHLSWYDFDKRAWLEFDDQAVLMACREGLSGSLTPTDVAQHLGLPRGEIALVAVNGRVVDPATAQLTPGDKVEFYPPIGGGSFLLQPAMILSSAPAKMPSASSISS
jgi:sulfur carrier protein ThiS